MAKVNANHNGYAWAESRYAQDFLDGVAEHKFARELLGLANSAPTEEWDRSRAIKCLNGTRRKRDLAKKRLDRYRRRLKKLGRCTSAQQ